MHLPETNLHTYISGLTALLLTLDPKDHIEDWLQLRMIYTNEVYRPKTCIVGFNQEINTNPYFLQQGICDCTHKLKLVNITFDGKRAFAANATRAIADLITYNALNGISIDNIKLKNWMDKKDFNQVFLLLTRVPFDDTQYKMVVNWCNQQ